MEKDNIVIDSVEFEENLYQKNLQENDFSGSDVEGIGDDENANN